MSFWGTDTRKIKFFQDGKQVSEADRGDIILDSTSGIYLLQGLRLRDGVYSIAASTYGFDDTNGSRVWETILFVNVKISSRSFWGSPSRFYTEQEPDIQDLQIRGLNVE
jgi:hypothetical protein